TIENIRRALRGSAPAAASPAPAGTGHPQGCQLEHPPRATLGAGRRQRRREDPAPQGSLGRRLALAWRALPSVPVAPAVLSFTFRSEGRDRLHRSRATGQIRALRLE